MGSSPQPEPPAAAPPADLPPTPQGAAQPCPSEPAQVVASAWKDQALWSAVSNDLGDSIRWWRWVSAAAGLAGLFLTILAGALSGGPHEDKRAALSTLGVLLLAVVPVLRQRLVSPERVKAWTTARNVSEQLKEAIYRHLMGVLPAEPPADTGGPAEAGEAANLVRRCRRIKQSAADLADLAAAAKPEPRERKTTMTLDDYLAERLEGQLRHYRNKGTDAGIAAKRLRALEFTLGIAGVLLGALTGSAVPSGADAEAASQVFHISALLPLLAVVSAATAAVTGHIAGARQAETAAKYFATYDLLKTLRDEWSVSPDPCAPAQVRQLADAVERAIAAEHGGWVTDWNQAQQKAPQA